MFNDARETARSGARKAGRAVEDGVDRVKDKVDEIAADVKVKKAEAERESVSHRNRAKKRMRGD
jgi:hypothetical protein